MKKILTISVLLFVSSIYAQQLDTLWLLNGKTKLIQSFTEDKEYQIIDYVTDKGKEKDVDVVDAFKVVKSNGETVYFYSSDSNSENTSVEDMEQFVKGKQYALKNYKAGLALVEGLVVGASAPFWGGPAFLPFVAPFANTLLVAPLNVSRNSIREKYPKLSENPLFVEGYRKASKQRRVKKSLVGGAIGLVTVFLGKVLFTSK